MPRARVAQALGLTARTLQRKLAEAGTTYVMSSTSPAELTVWSLRPSVVAVDWSTNAALRCVLRSSWPMPALLICAIPPVFSIAAHMGFAKRQALVAAEAAQQMKHTGVGNETELKRPLLTLNPKAARCCPTTFAGPLIMTFTRTLIAAALIASGSAAFAQAVITQNMAVAGGVTPGDTAGFPVTLSQPGSYKLTSNLFVPEGSTGVHITAANVTLDLNGFSIIGPSTCTRVPTTKAVTCVYTGSFAGVAVASTAAGAMVRGGTVKGFQSGVSSYASASVEDITATFNMQGVSISGGSGLSFRLSGINASYNAGNGIDVGSAIGTIERSQSNQNGGKGINAKQNGVTLFNVEAIENFGRGIEGGTGHAVYATDNGNGTNAVQNFYLFRSMGNNLNGTTQF